MRVKIGKTWFDSADGPIMIEFTEQDKENIANMSEGVNKYCRYTESVEIDKIIEKWIEEEVDNVCAAVE